MKLTRQPKNNNAVLLFFIVAMLFSAQASSLVHGVDHFNHETHELCESFLVFDYSPSIVDSAEEFSFERFATINETHYFGSDSQSFTAFYPIRAPPYSYS